MHVVYTKDSDNAILGRGSIVGRTLVPILARFLFVSRASKVLKKQTSGLRRSIRKQSGKLIVDSLCHESFFLLRRPLSRRGRCYDESFLETTKAFMRKCQSASVSGWTLDPAIITK